MVLTISGVFPCTRHSSDSPTSVLVSCEPSISAPRQPHSTWPPARSSIATELLIKCHHPSARVSNPVNSCDYLDTPGLIADHNGGDGSLRKLYSRFQPIRNEPDSAVYWHPAGDAVGSRTGDEAESSRNTTSSDLLTLEISLDAHENFSQLQFRASLGRIGPRRGVFLSIVDILEKKTVRLFRRWLADTAKDPESLQTVWVDGEKRVAALRVQVQEGTWRRGNHILRHKEEDQNVNYTVKLRGKQDEGLTQNLNAINLNVELLISTTQLLLAVEQSLLETANENGNAIIFASFVSQNSQQTQDTAEVSGLP